MSFRLISSSPAIDAGFPLTEVTNDFDGVSRPQGAGWDIGAYEYHGSDTTAPSVSITSPTGGTVSGTITITATASDSGGVAGVQFKVDGSDLGSEDTSSPYSVQWDSTSVTNGGHVITAIARDGLGNTNTAALPLEVSAINHAVQTTRGLKSNSCT